MKRIFSFILAAVCMLVFSGCAGDRGRSENEIYKSISDTAITEICVSDTASAVSGTVSSPETEKSETDSPPETVKSETVYSENTDAEPEILSEKADSDTADPEVQKESETYPPDTAASEPEIQESVTGIDESGSYTSKEDVALYIYTYGKLPSNFITKKEAESLGWSGGSLEPYAKGKCIGGSRFGNYEGILPDKKGRKYTECDIDTLGAKSRGAKRIVFSNDGLIYYTEDHYETFELLYGDEG